MTRSHSFNNLKAKSKSDLAHSLRHSRVDTNINITHFSAPASANLTPLAPFRPQFQPQFAHPGSYGAGTVTTAASPAFLHSRSVSLSNNKYPENSTNIVKSELSLYTPTLLVDLGPVRGRQAVLDAKLSDLKNSSLSSYNLHLNRSSSTTPQTSVTASENSKDHELVEDHPLPTCLSLESIRESAPVMSGPEPTTISAPEAENQGELDLASSNESSESSASSFTSADYGDALALTPDKDQEQSSVHEETHSGNASSAPSSPQQSEKITSSSSSVNSSSMKSMANSTAEATAVHLEEDSSSPATSHSTSEDRGLFTTPTNNDNANTSRATSVSEDEAEPNKNSSEPASVVVPKLYLSMRLDSTNDVKKSVPSENSAQFGNGPVAQPDAKKLPPTQREQSLKGSIQNSDVTISQSINNSSETLQPKTHAKPASIDTSKATHLEEDVPTPRSDYSFAVGEDKLICKLSEDVATVDKEVQERPQAATPRTSQIKREETTASISHILEAYSDSQAQGLVETQEIPASQPLPPLPPKDVEVAERVVESPNSGADGCADDVDPTKQDNEQPLNQESLVDSKPPTKKPLPVAAKVPSATDSEAIEGENTEPLVAQSAPAIDQPQLPDELKDVALYETPVDIPEVEQSFTSEKTKKPPRSPLDLTFEKANAPPVDADKNTSLISNRLSMFNVVNVDFDKNLPSTPQDMKFTVAMPDSVSPATKKLLSPEKPALHRTSSMSKSFSINNFKKVFSRFGGESLPRTPEENLPKKESFGGRLLRKKPSFLTERPVEKAPTSSTPLLSSKTSASASLKKGKRKFFKTIKIIPESKKEEVVSPVYSVRAKVPSPVLESFRDEAPVVNHYSLPAIETEEDGFLDILLKFDEVEKDLELEDDQLTSKPKSDAFFMKDDELTKAQIADQQRNDNHNSDENLLERSEGSVDDVHQETEDEAESGSQFGNDIPWSPGYDDFVSGTLTAVTDEGPKRVQSMKLDKHQLQEMLDKKAHSNHFIKHVRQMRDMDLVEIVVEAFNPHEKTGEPTTIGKEMSSILKSSAISNTSSGKAVKFSSKVSISETYPSYVYRRYNKSVTQYYLTESGEVNKIKNELNAYKCYEMLVHEKSQNNTQFFY